MSDAPQDPEAEAYGLLVEVVTLSKNGRSYKQALAKLRALLPKAPGVQAAVNAWAKRSGL